MIPICIGCNKNPDELGLMYKETPETDPIKSVKYGEGTYNRENGHFLSDICYINAGQPSSQYGWIAP